MGWSLNGILGAAMVGGAGAAERNFVETRRDEQAIAKAKELAEFNSNLQFDREQRVAEGRTARALKLEQQARDSDATNMELAKEYATRSKDDKDDPGAGAKEGTVEFYDAQADFLNRSGRKDLAKDMLAEANRIRVDDTKDQIATARAAGRASGGGGGGGGGVSASGEIDIGATIKDISEMTKHVGDNDKSALAVNPAQVDVIYRKLLSGGPDITPKQGLGMARSVVADAYTNWQRSGGKSSMGAEIDKIMGSLVKKAAPAEVKVEEADVAPATPKKPVEKSSGIRGRNPIESLRITMLEGRIKKGINGAQEELDEIVADQKANAPFDDSYVAP